MMSTYENEIINFFTKEESFKTMLQVASHVNNVTKYVVRNFWDSLILKLKEKYESPAWNVAYSDSFDIGHCKLWFYKTSWCLGREQPILAISFECLHRGKSPLLGIFINHTYDKTYKTQEIKNDISSFNLGKHGSVNGWHWYTNWKYMVEDMKDENLVNLLPGSESLDVVLNNYFDQMVQMVETFVPVIDGIIENERKYKIG